MRMEMAIPQVVRYQRETGRTESNLLCMTQGRFDNLKTMATSELGTPNPLHRKITTSLDLTPRLSLEHRIRRPT